MTTTIKIVQLIKNTGDGYDYCLDDKGNVYKIEYLKRNELTLVRQKIKVVTPDSSR
ncbi:MAG: hypothetical protein RL063_1651 [Pseudomonadota bacterium]|jgi:hypothetical protein